MDKGIELNSQNITTLLVPSSEFTLHTKVGPASGLRPVPLPPVNTLSTRSKQFVSIPQVTLPLENIIHSETFNSNTQTEYEGAACTIDELEIDPNYGVSTFVNYISHDHQEETNKEDTATALIDGNDTQEEVIKIPHHSNIVLQKLHSMQIRGQFCDVKITIRGQTLSCHSCVLASNSTLFNDLLMHDEEGNKNRKHIRLSESIRPDIFEIILQSLYSGKIIAQRCDIINILETTEYLKVTEISKRLIKYIKNFPDLIKAFENHRSSKIVNENEENFIVLENRFELSTVNQQQEDTTRIKNDAVLSILHDNPSTNNTVNNKLEETGMLPVPPLTTNDEKDKGCFEDLVKVASQYLDGDGSENVQGGKDLSNIASNEQRKSAVESGFSGNIICRFCKQQFENPSEITSHVLKTHPRDKNENKKRCELCGKCFNTAKQTQLHAQNKHDGKRFQCRFCDESFKYMVKCNQHEQQKHMKQPQFKCDICGKEFYLKQHYKRHVDNHGNFPCSICDKILTTKLGFNNHLTAVHGDKKWVCTFSDCSARFGNEKALQRHVSNHTTEREFHCRECSQSFKHRTHLKRHQYEVHKTTGNRTFACDKCNLCFHRSFQLKEHMVSHTDQRAFPCNKCNRTFKHKASLYLHMKKHTGVSDFVCDICGFKFITNAKLKEHLLKHTNSMPFVCKVCGNKFKAEKYLKRHARKHQKMIS